MSFDAHSAVDYNSGPAPETSAPATESTPAPETSTPAVSSSPTTPAVSNQIPKEAPTGTTPEMPVYSPNYKFKVMDKEHEIDEFVRGSIKDAESEKKIKELYEKAYGLDFVKPRFLEAREKYNQVNEQHTSVMKGIQELRETYSRGDFETFFQKLNIPQEKILQWVLDKAQYNELPPEQRQILDAKRAAENEVHQLRKQTMTLEQQYEEQVTQAKGQALQVALERPDVSQFAATFNSLGIKNAKGQTIGFRDAVCEIGEMAWYQSRGKVDLSPEQAIQEVMARYSGVVVQKPTGPQFIPNQGQTNPATQQPNAAAKKQATIPNIAGRQTSSVSKSKPKSIEDLKNRYAQLAGINK